MANMPERPALEVTQVCTGGRTHRLTIGEPELRTKLYIMWPDNQGPLPLELEEVWLEGLAHFEHDCHEDTGLYRASAWIDAMYAEHHIGGWRERVMFEVPAQRFDQSHRRADENNICTPDFNYILIITAIARRLEAQREQSTQRLV